MKKRLTIAGVIFDMDGLMFDTERLALISWQKAAKRFGFTLPEKLLIEVAGRNAEDTRKTFEREIGKKLPFDQLRALRLRYTRDAILEKGVPVKEGLYDMLDLLEKKSIPKAVATTTEFSIMEELLSLSRLLYRFDCLVCGEDVPQSKPAPDIFLLAAKRLSLSPQSCVVLEDSYSGIKAARNAGMIPILIPDLKVADQEVKKLAYAVFPSLKETALFILQKLLT